MYPFVREKTLIPDSPLLKLPAGGKTAAVVSVLKKIVVFAIAKLLIHSTKRA